MRVLFTGYLLFVVIGLTYSIWIGALQR